MEKVNEEEEKHFVDDLYNLF